MNSDNIECCDLHLIVSVFFFFLLEKTGFQTGIFKIKLVAAIITFVLLRTVRIFANN